MSIKSTIERERTDTRGRYVLAQNGVEAELTYSVSSPTEIIAEHTGVPEIWRGQGIAGELVLHMVTDARDEGVKITSRCWFVTAWRKRHPEWESIFSA